MAEKTATSKVKVGTWKVKTRACHFLKNGLTLLLFLVASFTSKANEDPAFDEITVYFNLPRIGGTDMSAIIMAQDIYLPVTEVFSFLKINNVSSPGMESVSGFFIEPKNKYLISKPANLIKYNGKDFDLPDNDLIQVATGLYMKLDYFDKVFGLTCTFNFRSLTVKLETRLDLPLFREKRQEQMRNNLKKLKGEVVADTLIGRQYSFLKLGMADWSALLVQNFREQASSRLNLRLGGMLAGGEATASLTYNSNTPFTSQQQFYQWRFVNNNNNIARQVTVGNIATQASSTIIAPVAGLHLTNTPTTYRKSFGTYTLSNKTEPDWLVELYINDVLINYVRADASGFYTFDVPLIYGNTSVKLRFYGPSGEEKFSEQNFNIPFNLLPQNVFEYSLRAGVTEDSIHSLFARGQFGYGLGKKITVGGGVEYLSSVTTGASMPFLNATMRLPSNMLFYSEYMHGVKSKSILSYRNQSNLQLEMQYTKYAKGQTAIRNNFLEERRIAASMPLRTKSFSLVSRLMIRQVFTPMVNDSVLMLTKYNDIPKHKNTYTQLLLSTTIARLNTNLATTAQFNDNSSAVFNSNLSIGYRFPFNLVLRSQLQYGFNTGQFSFIKFELEKKLMKKGYANFSNQKDFISGNNTLSLGFRWDLSFARTAFSVIKNNQNTSLFQSASGSLMYDAKTRMLEATNRSVMGRGGITIHPFLDINCNGKRDQNEPDIKGLKFRMRGGKILRNKEEAISRVVNLEPYVNYMIELDGNSFGNIAWQIKNKNISVSVDPNVFKSIDVPVSVLGEVNGMVHFKGEQLQGISRIIINFYDSTNKLVAHTLSEGDGYFSYLGLIPGTYTASVDTTQLSKLNFTSSPKKLSIHIAGSEEGTVADGFEFILQSLSDTGNYQRGTQNKTLPFFENKKMNEVDNNSQLVVEKTSAVLELNKLQPSIDQNTKDGVQSNGHSDTNKIEVPLKINAQQPSDSRTKARADSTLKSVNDKIAPFSINKQLSIDENKEAVPKTQSIIKGRGVLIVADKTKPVGKKNVKVIPQKSTFIHARKEGMQSANLRQSNKPYYPIPSKGQLLQQVHNQNKKVQASFKLLELLIREQKLLIDEQKILLKEIKDMKLQLLQKNSKK